MTHIEKLHLDAITSEVYIIEEYGQDQIADADKAAIKSAEITEKIAIEFAEWLLCNVIFNYSGKYRGYSNIELFKEYLKTKENEAKIHMVK
jgi:hypothetical protein